MKLLTDYTDEELAILSDDEKKQLFLLECAERGIALPASIPAYIKSPDESEDMKPDITVYEVGNYNFLNVEDASAVADLVASTAVRVDYDWRNSGKTEYINTDKDYAVDGTVKSRMIYSADKYAELKEDLKLFSSKKSSIEASNKRRQQIMDKHADLMTEIERRINEAVANVTRVKELADMFTQYLTMANNDHQVAVRFLLNAHYTEVSAYNGERLEKIGITEADVKEYADKLSPEEDE